MTLSQLTELTGLSPELIRAWERRYGFPRPHRTSGGHRRYGPIEVEILHRAALLVRSGYRARDAVAHARSTEDPVEPTAGAVAQSAASLAAALVAGEPANALSRMRATEMAIGFEQALEERVLPALRLVGDGWQDGSLSVAEEHTATGIVISWLGSVRSQTVPTGGPLSVLIATPSGENHAVAVWALELLLERRGVAALALGSDVPHDSLARELIRRRPRALVLSLARPNTLPYVRRALEAAQDAGVTVFAGGPGATRLPAGVTPLPPTLPAAADHIRDALRAMAG